MASATGNGTAVALLRYVDLTPEEQRVQVARVGVASEQVTRVPQDVICEARRLWEKHCGHTVAASWSSPFQGSCEVQWDPCLGVHGCDHGGNDDLGRQAIRAIGTAIAALIDRPDHTEGSALLDALRNHTAAHNDMPLPPTVAGWFQCINPKQHSGSGHHQQQPQQSVAIPASILAPLAPLYWVAHLVADPAGDAVKHVAALARAIIRERWDSRWLGSCLPLLAHSGAFGSTPVDACWLALVVVASASPNTLGSQPAQQVLREVRKAVGGSGLTLGISTWRNRLEDALRQAPTTAAAIPGVPPLNWAEDIMCPLLVRGPLAPPSQPQLAGWNAALALLESDQDVYDRGSENLCVAVWVWMRGRGRALRLAGWSCSDPLLSTAVCDALGPGFAALRGSLPGNSQAGPHADPASASVVTVITGDIDAQGLAELLDRDRPSWRTKRVLLVTKSTPPTVSVPNLAEWFSAAPELFCLQLE